MTTVLINRLDRGPRLVVERADELAVDFFTLDASSVGPNAYDAWAGRTDPDRITTDDVLAINRTMRARSPHLAWQPLVAAARPLPWLAALDPAWDLFELSDDAWAAGGCAALIQTALSGAVGPWRNLSVATKVLHLKRPRLVPVLDRLVLEQLGGMPTTAPIDLVHHLRSEGRANLEPLRAIQASLAARKADGRPIRRSLVRILDALLWATHPAAGLAPQLGRWEVRVTPVRPTDGLADDAHRLGDPRQLHVRGHGGRPPEPPAPELAEG